LAHTLNISEKEVGAMFANRCKNLRVSQGLNQVQLAEKLGVKKQSISNWENDNIMPSVEMLGKIADLFRVSTDYLLGRDDKPTDGIRFMDITGLSQQQADHIRAIVEDFRESNS